MSQAKKYVEAFESKAPGSTEDVASKRPMEMSRVDGYKLFRFIKNNKITVSEICNLCDAINVECEGTLYGNCSILDVRVSDRVLRVRRCECSKCKEKGMPKTYKVIDRCTEVECDAKELAGCF